MSLATPTLKQRIGETGILGLYLLLDVYFLWDEHRVICLLAAVSGAIFLLLLDGGIKSNKVIVIIATFLSVLACAAYYTAPAPLPKETETAGWLLPANEATPPNGCSDPEISKFVSADELSKAILFMAGGNGVLLTSDRKSPIIKIGNANVLYMEREGSKLLFDADIYNEKGNLVVRITKNQFHLISGEYSYIDDRNDDRSKLIVYDKAGQEMLYINYANPTTVLIRGYFVSPDGKIKVKIDDDKIISPFGAGALHNNCMIDNGNSNGAAFAFEPH